MEKAAASNRVRLQWTFAHNWIKVGNWLLVTVVPVKKTWSHRKCRKCTKVAFKICCDYKTELRAKQQSQQPTNVLKWAPRGHVCGSILQPLLSSIKCANSSDNECNSVHSLLSSLWALSSHYCSLSLLIHFADCAVSSEFAAKWIGSQGVELVLYKTVYSSHRTVLWRPHS